jgi:hypothetical protein
MSQSPVAMIRVTEAERNSRGEKLEPEKLEITSSSSTSRRAAARRGPTRQPRAAESGVRNFLQNIITSWQKSDPFAPADNVTKTLAVWKRILAGGFGALSVQSAIALSQSPNTATITLGNHRTLSEAAIPASVLIVVYWLFISCILFSGYNRKSDFVHVFRASILFNLFVVAIGSMGHLGPVARSILP